MSRGRLKIAIDIDDVIADTTDALRLWTNQKSGLELASEHFTDEGEYWGYYDRLWERHNVSHIVKYDDFHAGIARNDIAIPVLAGAEFAIHELIKKFDIVFITSRAQDLEDVTRIWINKNFGDYGIEIFFAQNHRYGISIDKKTKGQLCRELGASLLIDDSIQHCESALSEGIDAVLFGGDYGWQKPTPTELVVCKDWPAILEYVNGR